MTCFVFDRQLVETCMFCSLYLLHLELLKLYYERMKCYEHACPAGFFS